MNDARTRRRSRAAVLTAVAASACSMAAAMQFAEQSASAAVVRVPVYAITSEGLTVEQGDRLAEAAGIGNALRPDGSFSFRAEDFAMPPLKTVREGRSEDGPTVSQALDVDALEQIKTLPLKEARLLALRLLPVEKPYDFATKLGYTSLSQIDDSGKAVLEHNLETTVSFQLMLGGNPVVGPGAKVSVSFAGDGSVRQLTKATRSIDPAGRVTIIAVSEALRQCTALYGGASQTLPKLAYYAPPLAANEGSGEGAARLLTPQYICQPKGVQRDPVSGLTGRLVPAAPSLTPQLKATADYDGKTMIGRSDVTGGTEPYSFQWSSSTSSLPAEQVSEPSIEYIPRSRERRVPETLTLTVTDANGASEVLSMTPSPAIGTPGSASAEGTPGGQGGAFEEVGIEQTVDEWDCAQASAIGFKDVMQSQGQSVSFDWRGTDAWEQDFRETSLGGDDADFADDVGIQWYTGHGNPNSFTFKNTTHDDGNITPADGSWGTEDLEWLNLESCQVLKDTNGSFDFFGRWGPTMDGLHLLNGFHTNATCVGGGTGRRFAEYLFPVNFAWWQLRPALTVQQAWAAMANDLEPAGTRWRSMSLVRNGVNNLGDHYWGQGSTGPDLTYAGRTGMIAVSGLT